MKLMKRKSWVVFVALLVMVLSTVGIAGAITDGELDGDDHPQVVLIIMDIGGTPAYRCSGTMLSPTVVLTAGHCAGLHISSCNEDRCARSR